MKKIHYICSSNIPSTEANSVHVMKMSEAFYDCGIDATLIAPRLLFQKKKTDHEFLSTHYGIDLNFKLKYFLCLPKLLGRDFFLKTALYSKFKKVDCVYGRYLGALSVCADLGLKTILELHEVPLDNFKVKYFIKLCQSPNFLGVVVISNKLKEMLLARYSEKLKNKIVHVEPDGVDFKRYKTNASQKELRLKYNLSLDQIIIGYSGNIYPGRGIELIVELAKKFSNIRFILMGGGKEYFDQLKQNVFEQKIDNIHFYGFVPNSKLKDYLCCCDVLLMPYQKKIAISRGDRNTAEYMSPMKMFEYMASKSVILSSDLAVLREVLNEDNSILCDPEKVEEWSIAIEKIVNNMTFSQKIKNQAYEDVKRYDWVKRTQRIMGRFQL